ncbi:laccase domain-containing protein, partial [Citrobacter freundii]
QRLANVGVENLHGGDRCTFSESETFFSYRRDNTTGRMASFIWLI